MAFTKISHAQQNWEDVLNNNFSKINVDSGNIALPMLAPATGNLGFKLYNGVVFFFGAVVPNATGDVIVANVADAFQTSNFSVPDENGGQAISVFINGTTHQLILRNVPVANGNYALDGNSLLVGDLDLKNLGGGTPLKPLVAGFKAILRTIGGGLDEC